MAKLYWRIAEATGWTYAEIDAMRMRDFNEMIGCWREDPPLPLVVRAYLGAGSAAVEPDDDEPQEPREITEEEWQRMIAREKAEVDRINRQMTRSPFR